MGSTVKSALRIGATALMLLASIIVFAPGALAEAKPTPPSKPACVPTGGVKINGGSVTNTTNLDLTADGGTAIGDGSGGDDNVALTLEDGDGGDDQVAAAGNGGTADAGANGGAIATENVNSGDNQGNAISVGNTYAAGCAPLDSNGNPILVAAAVEIDGGTVVNETNINVSADGGTAIADASGGDNNIAINNGTAGSAGNGGVSSAGNGGTANSSANGGAISLGDINSGSNSGNTISVGNTISGGVPNVPIKPVPEKPGKPVPGKPGGKPTPAPDREMPKSLPDTGAGSLVQGSTNLQLLAQVLAAATVMTGAAGHQALRGRAR